MQTECGIVRGSAIIVRRCFCCAAATFLMLDNVCLFIHTKNARELVEEIGVK